MGFFDIFRRHVITSQTWQGDVVIMNCKCGGTIRVESARRAPVYLDAMPFPVGYRIEGTLVASSCKKTKVDLPKAIAL